MGDVRVTKPGEDGAFALEPRLATTLDERDVEQLHRGAALEPAVASFGEPHVAAAALADGGEQPVRAKDLPRERRHERQPRIDDDALEESRVVDRLVAREDGSEIVSEGGVARRDRRQPRTLLGGLDLQRLVEIRAERAPPFRADGRHWRTPVPDCRCRWRDADTAGPSP